jgi:drug/metabolite transporter (DMT)-like permease
MKVQDLLELLLLSALWGGSFLFMRTATPEFGAFALVELRTVIATACLFPVLLFARKWNDVKQYWKPILIIGLINTAIPFSLFSYATVHLGAGFGSILNATAPMFGAIVAYLWLKESLSNIAVLGLVTGFIGVVVISSARMELNFTLAILHILAALTATCAYGFAACYTKRYLAGVSTLAIATGSQIFAAIALFPFAVATWPSVMPSTDAWIQVIFLGVACTGLAYILYFRLIANVGASKAITVAYLIPVFGVFWGVTFLDESVSLLLIAGAGLILLGVAMTTGMFKRNAYSN